ncbi:hypothetical protein SCHPADRAFT_911817 [Schizopora paradoxa]|uniref:Uncharacterized protein n=1 Tax=Schizopora paradoxa TaxID=27342 RepID=A0A0H2QXR0_9AGAM|nr:hypothetical protein SCHPADRAFT_911817 [Schizopora paradoxa]
MTQHTLPTSITPALSAIKPNPRPCSTTTTLTRCGPNDSVRRRIDSLTFDHTTSTTHSRNQPIHHPSTSSTSNGTSSRRRARVRVWSAFRHAAPAQCTQRDDDVNDTLTQLTNGVPVRPARLHPSATTTTRPSTHPDVDKRRSEEDEERARGSQ